MQDVSKKKGKETRLPQATRGPITVQLQNKLMAFEQLLATKFTKFQHPPEPKF